MNLAKRGPPFDNVVDGTEIKNSVILRIGYRYMPHISDPEQWPPVFLVLPLLNMKNHFRIQVKCIDAGSTKAAEQKIDAETRAAADFQYPCPLYETTHF